MCLKHLKFKKKKEKKSQIPTLQYLVSSMFDQTFFASPERHFTNVAPSLHILAFISSKTALRASISVSCAGHETPRPLSSSGLGILAKGISFFLFFLKGLCVMGGLLEGEKVDGNVTRDG